uniref:Uncharacterized protein n=1 Tax=Oryza nivara TaxID=4536 RepID=A0A0E0I779_ORYNI
MTQRRPRLASLTRRLSAASAAAARRLLHRVAAWCIAIPKPSVPRRCLLCGQHRRRLLYERCLGPARSVVAGACFTATACCVATAEALGAGAAATAR